MARAPVPEEILALAAGAFGLAPAGALRPHGNGHIHETYAYTPAGEKAPTHILQRFNTAVFPDAEGVMANIAAVTAHLAAAGADARRRLTFLPDAAGRLLYPAPDGSLWRCSLFISRSLSPEAPENEGQMALCGLGVGAFLAGLSAMDAAALREPLPDFHNTPARFAQLAAAAEKDPLGRLAGARGELAFALRREKDCGALLARHRAGALPLRVTHNDAKMSNLLLDAATGLPLCLIDLDTVMPGLAAYDFGEAVRSGAAAGGEDGVPPRGEAFRFSYFAAFARGFLSEKGAGAVLTAEERAALPWGPRLMALENGMRFLADYLLGDPYYKTDYPAHNLARCRAQFALAAAMEARFGEMEALVRGL